MEFHKASAPEPSGTSQGICTGTLRNLTKHLLRQNPPKPHNSQGLCQNPLEPNQVSSRTSPNSCTGNFGNLTRYLHRNPPEPHKVSAPEPSGTAQNPPEPQQVSSPETSGTSRGICTGTLRNLTRYLHQNPPEPHRTLRSLSRYLHRKLPEPHEVSAPEPSETSRGICTRTLRNLVRNLVLKLHRIAQELIWAQDPIAMFCCWGKTTGAGNGGLVHRNYDQSSHSPFSPFSTKKTARYLLPTEPGLRKAWPCKIRLVRPAWIQDTHQITI